MKDKKLRKICPICKKKVYIETMTPMLVTIKGVPFNLPLICSKHYNHNKN